jgi:hypothetical protein
MSNTYHEALKGEAMAAIRRLRGDQSVTKATTIDSLADIQVEVEATLRALRDNHAERLTPPMPRIAVAPHDYDRVIYGWGSVVIRSGVVRDAGIDIDADDLIDTLVEIRPGPGSGFGSIVRSPQHVHVVSRVIGGIQVARKRSADFYRDRSGKVGEEG